MVQARATAERTPKAPALLQAAKTATAQAELEHLHAEVSYRVAYARLMAAIGAE